VLRNRLGGFGLRNRSGNRRCALHVLQLIDSGIAGGRLGYFKSPALLLMFSGRGIGPRRLSSTMLAPFRNVIAALGQRSQAALYAP
jgi:hypothetical protein